MNKLHSCESELLAVLVIFGIRLYAQSLVYIFCFGLTSLLVLEKGVWRTLCASRSSGTMKPVGDGWMLLFVRWALYDTSQPFL